MAAVEKVPDEKKMERITMSLHASCDGVTPLEGEVDDELGCFSIIKGDVTFYVGIYVMKDGIYAYVRGACEGTVLLCCIEIKNGETTGFTEKKKFYGDDCATIPMKICSIATMKRILLEGHEDPKTPREFTVTVDYNIARPQVDRMMKNGLWRMLEEQKLTDFTIKAEKETYDVHAVVMAASSPVLASAMILPDAKGHRTFGDDLDFSMVAWKRAVRYMYGQDFYPMAAELKQWDDVEKLYRLADFLQLNTLTSRLVPTIALRITRQSLHSAMVLSKTFSEEPEIRNAVRAYVTRHPEQVMEMFDEVPSKRVKLG